ncbi:hypothetical protein B4U37_10090 [Sutcliffiella horikoshii]|uniref:Swarming motility protein SwrB n=1 Tax=Sutcliffiella horikoshii TaxID=79883 RepID=A0ABN4ZDH5_9BACI|nr:hypothetical protein [Sutcliffiella horikoshii]ART76370.1 hypothetical protein B4U37_10090 [Sutcliffiella horikoshii]
MLIIFTIVNFALILLVIFFIILLFIKLSRVQQLEQEYRTLIQEAEDTITSYVLELKEENNSFLQKLSNSNHDISHSDKQESFDAREDALTEADLKELLMQENVREDHKETLIAEKPFEEWNFKDQVKHLSENGLTSSEIAKKLNKGKTEIELLLKFRQ